MKGTIVKTYGRFYTVECNNERLNCVLRGKIKMDKNLERFSSPVAVGDIVDFEKNNDGTGVINSICTRTNFFSRKDKGKNKEDLLAANLDLIVIIQSFKKPRLNLRFVDRLAVRGEKEGVPVVLCVNKSDIASEEDITSVYNYYKGVDVKIVITSAVTGDGLEKLKETISGKLSLFVGNSGAGKSTILNKLYPGLDLRVSEVSESTGKGRHTTTNSEMINANDGTGIIDSPGVREFGLVDIEPQFLGNYFYEFKEYIDRCKFKPCTHDHEPGCEIKKQVEKGNIFEGRYVSYINILNSLKDHYKNLY